jgi:hypothetical protein
VRLFSRRGTDFTDRYPKITTAVESLPVSSCALDGEAVVVDERGLSVSDVLRYRLRDHAVVLCAFDLIELYGEDLRWRPLEHRRRSPICCEALATASPSTAISPAMAESSSGTLAHSVAGRVDHRLKIKNPAAPAVKRVTEVDWDDQRWARGRRFSCGIAPALSASAARPTTRRIPPMTDWSDEETDDPLYADRRNFYKAEKWSRDGRRVEIMLRRQQPRQGARVRLTIRRRMRVLDEWPRHETLL